MLYYILTQGTKSSDYSFIINNGKAIYSDSKSRQLILEDFQKTDEKSKIIYSEGQEIIIKKINDNFLIEALTTNTDRVGRRVPVELLLKGFSKKTPIKKKLLKIMSILKNEDIILNEKIWVSIPHLLDESLKKHRRKKMTKIFLILIGLIVTIVLLILM